MSEFNGEIDSILEGMSEYMDAVEKEGGSVSYSTSDIDACGAVLRGFVSDVEAVSGNAAAVKEIVKKTVLALNKLNDSCGSEIIETDQREEIATLMIEVAAQAGYTSSDPNNEDITEEWREW